MNERIRRYEEEIGRLPPQVDSQGRLYGIFMMGNDHSGSGYYGSYPGNYLERMYSLFPETPRLHLFSGNLVDDEGVTVDADTDTPADVYQGVESFLEDQAENSFPLVLADPPYSREEGENYSAPYPKQEELYAAHRQSAGSWWLSDMAGPA